MPSVRRTRMKPWKEGLSRLLAILLLPILVIIAVISKIFEKPLARTRQEMADLMERSLAGDDDAWDELISVPIADAELDAIRKQCLNLNTTSEIQEAVPALV